MSSLSIGQGAVKRERARLLGGLAGVTIIYLLSLHAQIDLTQLWSADGWSNATQLLAGMTRPDLNSTFLTRIYTLMLESFAIGFLGLGLALVLGIPLALFAARLPSLREAPQVSQSPLALAGAIVRPTARLTLTLMRSIPEIIWAFLFVRILGLGPGPAVLAIGITFAGIIGKLFAELMESCPPEAGRALRASGSSPLAVALYGVLPQIRHQWVGYGLFRLECSIRSASVLGVVGAGGIGSELDLSVRYFQFDKLGTALLAVLACVVALEFTSQLLKRQHVSWSVGTVAVGVVWGLSLLDVRWSQLISPHAGEQIVVFLSSFSQPITESSWLIKALHSILQTLSMAACATALAAVFAFILAPFAHRAIATSRDLDILKPNILRRSLGDSLYVLARFICQVLRAIPELVWALIFVVWVGAGPMAGCLAIAAHTTGILGRLYGEVYDDVSTTYAQSLEYSGAGPLAAWIYGTLPEAIRPLLAFTLFRFEVNVRATAMVGFVGAGGIGNDIHTAISLFHFSELATLLLMLLATVALVDSGSSALRRHILTH